MQAVLFVCRAVLFLPLCFWGTVTRPRKKLTNHKSLNGDHSPNEVSLYKVSFIVLQFYFIATCLFVLLLPVLNFELLESTDYKLFFI